MLIDIKAIKEYLNDDENTGYRICKDTGLSIGQSYSLKNGTAKVEKMSVENAMRIQKVINDKRTDKWAKGPTLQRENEND